MKNKSHQAFLDSDTVSLKICGVTLYDEARELAEIGVPALGFNFWEKSKRFLSPQNRHWLSEVKSVNRVGVFVNAARGLIEQLVKDDLIDTIQLHGDESPEEVAYYKKFNVPLIKAFGVDDKDSLPQTEGYDIDAVLLDTKAPGDYGGTGESFDWSLARNFKASHRQQPLILAGGINQENIVSAIQQVRPVAIDVASGAEVSPGRKDMQKVKSMLEACRNS